MRSIGPSGREATGTQAVALKAALMLMAGLLCCAAAGAAEPERLRTASLPQTRLVLAHSPTGSIQLDPTGFRPERLLIDRSAPASVRFYDTHLMPELRSRFAGMASVYQNMPWAGSELEQFTMRAEVTDSVRHGFERATTRALRDFALEWTQIEERLLSIPLSRKLSSAAPSINTGVGKRSHEDLHFSFGISSMMPEVGVRYRFAEMETRFEVDGHGSVDLAFSRSADVYTRIAVQYDAEEQWYGLYYRARF